MKKLDSVYNIFDIVDKNFNYASKRFELADDNRRVKLRVNTQFHDVVDEATQEQTMASGIFLEIYDAETSKVIGENQECIHVFY